MAEGKIREGIEVKDQGFVPYNGPKNENTQSIAKAEKVKGMKKGMGAALRGGKYANC